MNSKIPELTSLQVNHKPVLLKEVFTLLKPVSGEFFVDGTLGMAGHAREALKKISPGGLFLGIERDKDSAERAESILRKEKQKEGVENIEIIVKVSNFTEIPEIIAQEEISRKPDCLLLDLGFSLNQVFSGKGFSYDQDEPLIMRYDGDVSKLTAARVVNEYDCKTISEILEKYGEERFAKRIAEGIVKKRKEKPLRTTKELAEAVRKAIPQNYPSKARPEARTFFALRNFINEETKDLEKIVDSIPDFMSQGGRAAVITFNSLEDKIVKETFKELSNSGNRLLTKKPITPTKEEIEENNKSRSAKLRVIKLDNR